MVKMIGSKSLKDLKKPFQYIERMVKVAYHSIRRTCNVIICTFKDIVDKGIDALNNPSEEIQREFEEINKLNTIDSPDKLTGGVIVLSI